MHARRIGILGGTFDPIHRGHVDLGTAAETTLGLTRLFIVPASAQPLRPPPVASSFHRFAMAAIVVTPRPAWQVSDVELRSEAPSYTSVTLKRFQERGYPPSELYFVVGADAFADFAKWKDYPGILQDAHFVVVSRPGWSVEELPNRLPDLASRMERPPIDPMPRKDPSIILIDVLTADVSATAIRQRRAEGQPITGLVEPAVEQHIKRHGLYAPVMPGRRGSDQAAGRAAGRLHGEG
jgi:nicotinate-nucleotide adenylyltransferase